MPATGLPWSAASAHRRIGSSCTAPTDRAPHRSEMVSSAELQTDHQLRCSPSSAVSPSGWVQLVATGGWRGRDGGSDGCGRPHQSRPGGQPKLALQLYWKVVLDGRVSQGHPPGRPAEPPTPVRAATSAPPTARGHWLDPTCRADRAGWVAPQFLIGLQFSSGDHFRPMGRAVSWSCAAAADVPMRRTMAWLPVRAASLF